MNVSLVRKHHERISIPTAKKTIHPINAMIERMVIQRDRQTDRQTDTNRS